MLIVKGGITREIDEARLQEYRDKGYAEEAAPEIEAPQKKIKK